MPRTKYMVAFGLYALLKNEEGMSHCFESIKIVTYYMSRLSFSHTFIWTFSHAFIQYFSQICSHTLSHILGHNLGHNLSHTFSHTFSHTLKQL